MPDEASPSGTTPDPTDHILDGVVEVVIPADKAEDKGESTMPMSKEIHEQNLARLAGAGAQSHEHFVTFGKILDLNYEADRKMVSLVESLGVREVTSQSGHTGVGVNGVR